MANSIAVTGFYQRAGLDFTFEGARSIDVAEHQRCQQHYR